MVDGNNYRIIELTGSSSEGVEAAIRSAIQRAGQSLRQLRWFETTRISGHVVDGEVAHYQVTLKLGFTLEEPN